MSHIYNPYYGYESNTKMVMNIEVSNGEILDKISILTIKKDKITDKTKRDNVYHEYQTLLPFFNIIVSTPEIGDCYYQLHDINRQLWNVEDDLRDLERDKNFGSKFVELARSVYHLNDKRAEWKKQINLLSGSDLIEEKSYSDYN